MLVISLRFTDFYLRLIAGQGKVSTKKDGELHSSRTILCILDLNEVNNCTNQETVKKKYTLLEKTKSIREMLHYF